MWIRLHSTFGGQSRVGAGFMEFLHEKNVIRVVGELYKQLPSPPHPSSTNTTSSPDSSVENKPRKQRLGGKESFNTLLSTQEITKRESVRCFRVLTYKKSTQGSGRILVDLLDGSAYSFQITHGAIVYPTKQGALSERFPPTQYGSSKSGNGMLPRVLVAFDCWGECTPRTGGGLSCIYQYAKFSAIVECLDPISPHSAKHAPFPVSPNFFPKPDTTKPPRRQNNRMTRVTRSLNTY